MTETPADVRIFTVAKANSALPLVRRIVDDVVSEHARWRDAMARYELAAAGSRPEWGESPDMAEQRRLVAASAERISGYVAELDQVGVQLKGFEQGLVDFWGQHEGRLVHLCWQLGEPAVSHWHEVDAGFAGRQPITPAFDAEGA